MKWRRIDVSDEFHIPVHICVYTNINIYDLYKNYNIRYPEVDFVITTNFT